MAPKRTTIREKACAQDLSLYGFLEGQAFPPEKSSMGGWKPYQRFDA
jgi:hypothetical protein